MDTPHDPEDCHELSGCSRSGFLAGSALALAGPVFFPARVKAEVLGPGPTPRTKVILLGTGGGPPISERNQTTTLVVVDGVPYLVDCGSGVLQQMFRAGVELRALRGLFITHHHSDHIADYGALLSLTWGNGLATPIDVYGPPPLAAMTNAFFEMFKIDIAARTLDEGRTPLAPLVRAHEISDAGIVFRDERVTVTAALVHHPPLVPSFAFRFDTPDRSVVISGDTSYSENLQRLAGGADLLVHEALYAPAMDTMLRLTDAVDNTRTERLRAHMFAAHCPTTDIGKLAAAARVKSVVLTHLIPRESISDDRWRAGVREHYGGPVTIGKDLLVV